MNKHSNVLGWLLIISIAINIYQFGMSQTAKDFEKSTSLKRFEFISSSLESISENLEDFIKMTAVSHTKGQEDTHKICSIWNGIYSMSKELEFMLNSVNTNYFKSVASEIQNTQRILQIINKNLYVLNIEFLNKDPQSFVLTDEKKKNWKQWAQFILC